MQKQSPIYKIPQPNARIQSIAPQMEQAVAQQNVDRNPQSADERLVLYTKTEVAELLKVSQAAISAWITRREIKPTKVGRCTRISLAELRRFLRSSNRED